MSISSIEVIKNRIKSASPLSKIAVFKVTGRRELVFDAVFDNTITTQKRILNGCDSYIGSYCSSDQLHIVESELNAL